jgi:hypothetical protein
MFFCVELIVETISEKLILNTRNIMQLITRVSIECNLSNNY